MQGVNNSRVGGCGVCSRYCGLLLLLLRVEGGLHAGSCDGPGCFVSVLFRPSLCCGGMLAAGTEGSASLCAMGRHIVAQSALRLLRCVVGSIVGYRGSSCGGCSIIWQPSLLQPVMAAVEMLAQQQQGTTAVLLPPDLHLCSNQQPARTEQQQ